MADDGKSSNQILQELDALSHTMYQAHTNRRTASLALPRSATEVNGGGADVVRAESRPRSRRLSLSPFRSRPKQGKNANDEGDDDDDDGDAGARRVGAAPSKSQSFAAVTTPAGGGAATAGEKKGIWSWKPIRALSHIGMNRLGCLFSVEVVAAQGLPPSMNGLRLAVAVRKKETRDGAVQTMPSRVQQGAADFEETLFVRCHLYCSGGAGTGKPLKFEPRPFLLSAVAVDAPELDFGRSAVNLSLLVKESTDKSHQGERVRQWDMALPLAGKAKGGELVVKLSFQIMDDGGVGLYKQPEAARKTTSSSSSLFARKQSKLSFSITSPKVSRPEPTLTATKGSPSPDLKGIDDFKLDEPNPPLLEAKKEPEPPETEEKGDDSEFPEFDVVDKGVEGQEENVEAKGEAEDGKEGAKVEGEDKATSAAGDEVVKEVVHDSAHAWRINELEAITNQIKALESMMLGDAPPTAKTEEPQDGDDTGGLDTDEEEVTREFLQLLEQGDGRGALAKSVSSLKSGVKRGSAAAASSYISDLGKGLGPIVQTRDGGYLTATNPFDIPVERKELPKLAMQLSKPFILQDQRLPGGGAELFQRLCAGGCETLFAKLAALIATDEVVGKTAEQIAFEGMASAIISARSAALGASSSAAQSVSLLRTMSTAMSDGRKERIATGIWNAQETPVTVDEILAFSLQKIETMAIDALKVQADMADEQAPFDVSPVSEKRSGGHLLDTAVPPEEWALACIGADTVTMLLVAQLRDPLRRYEAVGAPSIVIIQAIRAAGSDDDEPRFKVANLHVGGLRLKSADRRNVWDGEKQRLTAMHWLVAYGLGKAGRKGRTSAAAAAKAGHDVLWSMSSRVMADMWLKPMRNPDVKIPLK
ncbi:protein PLASTID MOVEMENT IMPAIRED 1 [Oryza brachyantha]|uniref:protein PLASTID MOVEMENT IMPAIRED 1 n=1 Tax=Oryza brachyantha TaxID=4533 RepID=UPI001ADB9319|nr:protein PLASTID MOVEMENT IMPAIRED 1 [Oryza brachyantha]